ncbi:MAG: hypothetical protein JOZ13_09630, partial [Alphaproteobacteria bacterium]|nr:hypothetical protein [Alphaproteobacteria bacterium]
MKAVAALAALLALAAWPSRAAVNIGDLDLTCRLHHRVSAELNALTKTPQFLQDYVASSIGPMAERGEAFNETDVHLQGLPNARFVRAGRAGNEWYLWYERGGFV